MDIPVKTVELRVNGQTIRHTSISHISIFKNAKRLGYDEPMVYMQQRRRVKGHKNHRTKEIVYPLSSITFLRY